MRGHQIRQPDLHSAVNSSRGRGGDKSAPSRCFHQSPRMESKVRPRLARCEIESFDNRDSEAHHLGVAALHPRQEEVGRWDFVAFPTARSGDSGFGEVPWHFETVAVEIARVAEPSEPCVDENQARDRVKASFLPTYQHWPYSWCAVGASPPVFPPYQYHRGQRAISPLNKS